jgi:hypothetical protein
MCINAISREEDSGRLAALWASAGIGSILPNSIGASSGMSSAGLHARFGVP